MAARTKADTVSERIYLTFPRDLIKEPVLSMLSKQFDVIFNIRGSTVTAEMGLVALEIDGKESDEYYYSRPLGSRIGAWASPQSKVINDRSVLEEKFLKYEQEFASASVVPRPPYWGGYRVIPSYIEFWQGRESRLHDRIAYQLEATLWNIQRLAPKHLSHN